MNLLFPQKFKKKKERWLLIRAPAGVSLLPSACILREKGNMWLTCCVQSQQSSQLEIKGHWWADYAGKEGKNKPRRVSHGFLIWWGTLNVGREGVHRRLWYSIRHLAQHRDKGEARMVRSNVFICGIWQEEEEGSDSWLDNLLSRFYRWLFLSAQRTWKRLRTQLVFHDQEGHAVWNVSVATAEQVEIKLILFRRVSGCQKVPGDADGADPDTQSVLLPAVKTEEGQTDQTHNVHQISNISKNVTPVLINVTAGTK